eukprot:m.30337 g.30337  ORF g.30337 m.30337 type:complete len:164 (-) comp10555_c0_seq4:35-526(-)
MGRSRATPCAGNDEPAWPVDRFRRQDEHVTRRTTAASNTAAEATTAGAIESSWLPSSAESCTGLASTGCSHSSTSATPAATTDVVAAVDDDDLAIDGAVAAVAATVSVLRLRPLLHILLLLQQLLQSLLQSLNFSDHSAAASLSEVTGSLQPDGSEQQCEPRD